MLPISHTRQGLVLPDVQEDRHGYRVARRVPARWYRGTQGISDGRADGKSALDAQGYQGSVNKKRKGINCFMRFRNVSKWGEFGAREPLLFFAQRSEEILFEYTLDSYKTMALNSSFLCLEAIALIGNIENGVIDSKNLDPVLEELRWSLSVDKIAKELMDLESKDYVLDPKNESLEKVKLRLEVLSKTLRPDRYFERGCALLAQAIGRGAKKEIDSLAGGVFTTLVNMGCHKQDLYTKTVSFFYGQNGRPNIEDESVFFEYIKLIWPAHKQFKAVFIVSSLFADVKDAAEQAFDVKICEEMPEEFKSLAIKEKYKVGSDEVLAEVSGISAIDYYSARELANANLGRLRDLFTLYHHKNQIKWRDKAMVKEVGDELPLMMKMPTNPIEKVKDQKPGMASESLTWMLKNFSMRDSDFKKFARIVDFHGLSVNSSEPENQLLNLWIALESLVPASAATSKINQIINSIVPVLGMEYFARLVQNLAQDLIRWDRGAVRSALKKVPDSDSMSLREKVMQVVLSENCDVVRSELYEKLKDFHLLRYRLFTMHECFKTPRKMIESIEKHEEKVTWQIRRIYRTRNLIVHSASSSKHINSLIENGHDYLDQVVFMITKMSGGSYGISSISQAFELARLFRLNISRALGNAEVYDDSCFKLLLGEHEFMTRP
ncbi:hypothetical protein [Salinicola endophyticus]|uniref:hypothetical protein n=1 Tax=Salinicola endophyticus TaxID=1949083 RepID=UPI001300BCC8|nr:hypothetical protein [Salinicola endophyticus]